MVKTFWKDESGQGMVEYALIVALIAIIVIAGVKLFGRQIGALFTSSQQQIQGETGVAPTR